LQIVPRYITSGDCQDITKAIEERKDLKIRFTLPASKNFAYEGKSYGLPNGIGPMVFW